MPSHEERNRRDRFVKAVLDAIDSLVMVLDFDGRIQRVNRAWEQTMGYSGEEAFGQPATDFMRTAESVEFDFLHQVRNEEEFEDTC